MARIASLALAGLLAACATPAVTGAGPDAVTVRFDPLLHGRAALASEARRQCAAFGRDDAQFVSETSEAPLGFRYATFRCVDAVSP
jgi:hypothetical protein